ncbi:NAD(P)H-dependent oxidoreductase subunit E [Streptomyces sp. ME18-1-4]|uniref:NAD(P)H-dependent oxidoreductase subunit E n=1 Tax=Streptomyces sp. ME18-1-4 TaxID=3028685 RepID=UPI0029CA8AEC|nr:NAD(P)H-dependent oxidoreductase subunit E [Streptomyces sp. ME18-1-4]
MGRYASGLQPLRGQNNVQGGGDMGAIPNRLPGFQDILDPGARLKFESAWDTVIESHYGLNLTEMFGALDCLCRRLTVPPAEAYGVATFYAMFSVRPRPATVLQVCTDLACTAAGASDLCAGIEARAGLGSGVSVERSPCLGLCERAPAALTVRAGDPVRTAVSAPATVEAAVLAASAPDSAPEEPPAVTAVPQAGDPSPTLLGRVGVVDPSSLDDYRAHGGYTALRRAFALGPAAVIREVTDSGLLGRGGAAFPTGRKWRATASQPDRPHYLVCLCPTGALSFKSEFDRRAPGTWDESAQTQTTTVCACCGVGCNLTLHVQDNEIVKVTSPHDNPVTHGKLCIKGRFGYQHIQNRG